MTSSGVGPSSGPSDVLMGYPSTPPPETKPSSDDDALWNWMESLVTEAARVKRLEPCFENASRYTDLYYGYHYPDTLPSFRPPVVVNELRTLILQEANDLSDTSFRPYIMKDPRHGTRDEEAERALRALWVREEIDLKLVEALVWERVLGTGFLRTSWDPNASNGMGDVIVDVPVPYSIIPDPDAANDRKMSFLAYETVMDLSELRRLFPKRGYDVKPEDAYSSRDSAKPESGDRAPSNLTPGGLPYWGPLTEGASLVGRLYPGYKKARARVIDLFVLDDSVETTMEEVKDKSGLPVKDEAGNPKLEQVKRMKYPRGRRIVGANGIILHDAENTNPPGDFGLVRVVLEPTLGKFWGEGFIHQTGELQLAADKLMSAVVENAIRLNNGIVVVEGNTGLDWESFASIPGQIVQINQGSKFAIQYPPPMPPDMIQAPGRFLDMQRRILGFPDPRTGTGGRGNTGADLTETEISQSQGTTRLRSKHLYFVVKRLAEMLLARMIEGYTSPRAIPAVEGEQFKPVMWKPVDNPQDYSVFIDPASFQVMSRTALRRLALALYRMKGIDRRAALEQVGFPHWEEIADRLDKQEAMMAQAAAAAKKRGKGRA